MKMNRPAFGLTLLVVVSLIFLASPASALPGTEVVRVGAQVSAEAVRIEARASGAFTYTTARPSEHLLVVDLAGVAPAEPSLARVLASDVVSSYRVLPLNGSNVGARLEILLRTAAQPRFERRGQDELTIVFEQKTAAAPSKAPAAPEAAIPAVVISQVEIGREGQQTQVRVAGSGRLSYHATRLNNPERLVLDFTGARLAVGRNVISSSLRPVRGVRMSQFAPDVTRVVIDLEQKTAFSVKTEVKSLTVTFTANASPAAAPKGDHAAPKPVERASAPAHSVQGGIAVVPVAINFDISFLPLPASLTKTTVALARPAQQPPAASNPAPASSEPQASTAAVMQAPATAQPVASGPEAASKYSGEPISVNLKDVDLKDFFRLIHEISGLNVVLDPAVKGSVTLVLDDVPWDQALDIVMQNNGLDKQLEGNVLRIATHETIKKEAETKRDLIKAQAEAVEQVTTTRVLSYAKASALRDTLKRFLSPRGDILADERSNTLIIRDIPTVLPAMDNLIRQLDRKGQQVEIEARVVAASRSFARDIGTQFGFAGSATGGRSVFGGVPNLAISPLVGGPLPPLVGSPVPTPIGSTGIIGGAIPLNTALGATAPNSGVSFIHRSPNFAVDFIITAAEAKGVGKLLSKPKVITQNNEKATVKQGTKIPVQTTINNTISVQFIDAVLKLEVTPQITAEGTVFMEVLVENTQIDTGIPRVQGIPALNTQSAETRVVISDGGTVVVGGVIISSQRTDVNQVPLFGSIPLIGHLFKRTAVNVQSQELLFFLTPRIVPG